MQILAVRYLYTTPRSRPVFTLRQTGVETEMSCRSLQVLHLHHLQLEAG